MTLAIVTPGRSYSPSFVKCIVNTTAFCLTNGINLKLSQGTAANLYTSRIQCLSNGDMDIPPKVMGGVDYDYILMLDSDMSWTQEDLGKALELGETKDIVTGIYLIGTDGKLSIARERREDEEETGHEIVFYNLHEDLPEEPFQIDYAGLGFVLLKKGVVEKLEWPWFQTRTHPENDRFMGEDLSFSLCLKEQGFDIWCDPSILLGHQKYWELSPQIEGKNGGS